MATVRLAVATTHTSHPAGTVGGNWQFMISKEGILHEEFFTASIPALLTEIDAEGEYEAEAYRLDEHVNILGVKAYAKFTIGEGVLIETAGTLSVEVL